MAVLPYQWFQLKNYIEITGLINTLVLFSWRRMCKCCVNKYVHIAVGRCILKYFYLHVHVTCSKKKSDIKKQVVKSSNPVLSMSGCTLYSLAKTKGTIPWGRAACKNNTKWSKSQNRLYGYGYPKENTCYLDLCMKDILAISLNTRACKLGNLFTVNMAKFQTSCRRGI